ncbi:hypothetical protein BDV38DRAFT_282619 [Aspergillus pseudotamarii]|uniref:GPI anchored protein n=1 Tax=Aspergillus pseudotamarii TaxID=132259 RepID=A0A5N6SST3_ASPPS|nr:uncharacterized protein BDV38DRAFT_282619 [Aspergillus pseudotamarii]KAE8137682.1 hypothetical protein BDV38DRAFT_282619 [Aspergillus pseudotamarii]
MRTAQLLALSGLMLMSNVAMGAELEHDDVPNRCWDVCGPVVGIAHKCDNMHDSDRAEMQCICDWKQAPSLIPLCEACIAQYRSERNNRDHDDDDDDDDRNPHHNDAYDILTSCSLSTTSYNPTAAASAVSSASANGTGTTPTATSSGIADSTNGGTSGNSNRNSASSTNSAASAQNTDNAASAYSSPKAASLAAVVGLGFLAWL